MPNGIREVTTTKNKRGDYESVRLVFGPHYFVQLKLEDLGAVTFVLEATHHGFKGKRHTNCAVDGAAGLRRLAADSPSAGREFSDSIDRKIGQSREHSTEVVADRK